MKLFYNFVTWICLSGIGILSADEMKIHEHSGETVTIICSYSWASNNIKYFCRDPCKDSKDILVKSDQSPTGRYRLKDSGEGTFTVNITDLQESDSGIYWCGVDRFGFDTFTKVKLTVSKGFVKASGPAGEKAGAEHRNSSSSAHIFPVPLYYIPYAAAGLAIMVIICAAGLVTVLQCRKRVKKSRCVIARSIYNSRHNEETNAVYQNAPDDRPYATINKSSTKSKDESQSDPIYQNIHFNTTQEETIYGNL